MPSLSTMPNRAPKPCRVCGVLVYDGTIRCSIHQSKRRPGYDQDRPSPSRRGYDRNWSRIRAAKLKQDPWCQGQHAYPVKAQVVDHKKPLSQGGTNESSIYNHFAIVATTRSINVDLPRGLGEIKSLQLQSVYRRICQERTPASEQGGL